MRAFEAHLHDADERRPFLPPLLRVGQRLLGGVGHPAVRRADPPQRTAALAIVDRCELLQERVGLPPSVERSSSL